MIFTGKKHRQRKSQRLEKVRMWAYFVVTMVFVLTLASNMAVLHGNNAFSILVRSTKK